MKTYNEILKRFCSKSELKGWMQKPFLIEDKAYSTDAHVMAICPSSKTEGLEQIKDYKPENILSVIPKRRREKAIYSISELKDILENAPYVDDIEYESETCDKCDGWGDVDWEFETWTREFECPNCDGEGEVETKSTVVGKKIKDNYVVRIGNSFFKGAFLNEIIDSTKDLNSDDLKLVYQGESNKASVFKIHDIEFLVMPYLHNGAEKLHPTLNPKKEMAC